MVTFYLISTHNLRFFHLNKTTDGGVSSLKGHCCGGSIEPFDSLSCSSASPICP
jgi:hypothetical protein